MEDNFTSVVFLIKMHNLNLIMKKNQTNPNLGEFDTITGQYSSKLSMSLKPSTPKIKFPCQVYD